MELTWLESFADSWQGRAQHGRIPHAVMLLGAAGVGKRCAAAWIARQRLGIEGAGRLPAYPLSIPAHPDLRWICPAEDKHTIGIEQIRGLVADLGLTSFDGGGKVAVIEPANAMTANAANSLLKTLEEPPGDTLLVLVTDRTGRLPATVFSRCQRVNMPIPPESESLVWLDRLQPAASWPRALRAAGNAPLAAITASERLEATEAMSRDFSALSTKQAAPLDIAAKWARLDPAFVLDWLCREVQKCIYGVSGATSVAVDRAVGESVLKRMDRRNLFCYLDIINRLRGQPVGSFNVQLTMESLLIDWAGDLHDCAYSSGFPSAPSTTR
jgi:DNA polymerase-3 subunit delta'